jgi:flavin reductase (DIM6/NTAB) family NADH-FMN oxidoreductase RutF
MSAHAPVFTDLTRQRFRRYFQPSRLLIGVFPGPGSAGVNLITLSFNMYCSYKPVMLAAAVHNINDSFDLINMTREYVLAVPGERLAEQALDWGTTHGHEVDKGAEAELVPSKHIAVPGLLRAIANIEMRMEHLLPCGDHALVVGRVLRFAVNLRCEERPLLSVGPDTRGFDVLARSGIHRIGAVRRG